MTNVTTPVTTPATTQGTTPPTSPAASPTTPPTTISTGASTRWFFVVGGTAALTHMAVFALTQHMMWPELANALGFCVGFFVSFTGHRFLSFRDTTTSLTTSLARFVLTALAGFAVNEGVFLLLFRAFGWPSLLALFCALVIAAGQTFLVGRFWAFKR